MLCVSVYFLTSATQKLPCQIRWIFYIYTKYSISIQQINYSPFNTVSFIHSHINYLKLYLYCNCLLIVNRDRRLYTGWDI